MSEAEYGLTERLWRWKNILASPRIKEMNRKKPEGSGSAAIKLVIGIGNPGKRYSKTYHNAGSLAVQSFVEELSGAKPAFKKLASAEYLKIGTSIFARSAAFMNESGMAVSVLASYFRIKPEEILVVQDDSDIKLGEYKFTFGSGSAGHKGINSVMKALGTRDFWRLRIGIRPKITKRKKADLSAAAPRVKAGDFVLRKISAADKKLLDKLFRGLAYKINGNPATLT